jgi:hypothetical protein
VQAQREGRPVQSGIGRLGEAADRDQEALCGDRIGDNDTQERAPYTPLYVADFAHHQTPLTIMGARASRVKQLTDGLVQPPCRGRYFFSRPSLWPHDHEHRSAAFGDELVALVVHAVMKLDDAGAGSRF